MAKQDRPAASEDQMSGEKNTFAQRYTEVVRRLHLIIPLALLIPLIALVPIGGMEASEAAAADSRLVYAYLSGLLLAIPCGLMHLAESRISHFVPYFLICSALMTGTMAAAYFYGRAAGLSVQGSDLVADVLILLFIFFDTLSIRYNENSRIRSKREGDLSWTQDRKFLPGPSWFIFLCFAGIYAISLFGHSKGLGNAALAGGIIYFFLFYPYVILKGRVDFLESRKHVKGVPAQRIRKLNNKRIPEILLPASLLAAAAVMTAGGRQFIDLPSFGGPVNEGMLEGGIRDQQFMLEALRQMLREEAGAEPPVWIMQLFSLIENIVTVACVALFVFFLVRLVMLAASRFGGIEKEPKKAGFADGIDEHFSLKKSSSDLFRSQSGVRRRYRRLILRYRGCAPGISETPAEMEQLSDIPESEGIRDLHEEYEKIRYGRN